MNEIGLMLTISGMGGVFIVLSILAFVMWGIGKIFGGFQVYYKTDRRIDVDQDNKTKNPFSDAELRAIAAAIIEHESVRIPEMKIPENWRRYARSYSMGWLE